jgi:hypothetical protein
LMTEQQKLAAICEFVRSQGVSLRIRQVAGRRQLPNGWYENGQICIYTRDRVAEASATASMILHEYGHHLAGQTIGDHHSEHDAWDLACQVVPRSIRPRSFARVRRHCLGTYAAVGIY